MFQTPKEKCEILPSRKVSHHYSPPLTAIKCSSFSFKKHDGIISQTLYTQKSQILGTFRFAAGLAAGL